VTADVVVVGLGAQGSALAQHLAQAGASVIGVDRFEPPHDMGSSHGETRITRKAYWEGSWYLPLLERSYELWDDLERATGQRLRLPTGGLMLGPEASDLVEGARRTAEAYDLPHELLSPEEVVKRFPAFRLPSDQVALLEPQAAVLFPEACISAQLEMARRAGADLQFGRAVTGWRRMGAAFEVATSGPDGSSATLSCGAIAVASGSWIGEVLPDLRGRFRVERQVSTWWEAAGPADRYLPDAQPIYMWEYAPGHQLYGFPDVGTGGKHGLHHNGAETDHPDRVNREVAEVDVQAVRERMDDLLPGAAGTLRTARVCLYTNSPDGHYVLGELPGEPGIWVSSACSGHGFKAANAIGESLAASVLGHDPPVDLAPFSPSRLEV
jgi:monomeric sarcosine oxidase